MGKKAKRAMMAKAVALAASKKIAQEGKLGKTKISGAPATAKAAKKSQPSELKRKVKELRRTAKMQKRKDQKRREMKNMWEGPPPSNLVGKLELPKPKYHSYFEFMENTERKEKKLEFQVTRTKEPFPGYKFVPVGDPIMTTKCKELSREQGAMIYIVSETTEQMSKISDHVHRIGYHFREYIVDEARAVVGETKVSTASEPIPKSQEEINNQADAALRDLFPRIPNTDRQMILDHAFKLGNVFNGAPVVGLQADIPLSRRVQLAVLAHIRHTHTRYDLLLRETSWENARKVVEPICLDFIIKWRGDEETGRDQISEILREIVVISDSEDSSDDSLDDDDDDDDENDEDDDDYDYDSSDEGEVSSTSSDIIELQDPVGSKQVMQAHHHSGKPSRNESLQHLVASSPYLERESSHKIHGHGDKAQRGFKRYQAAWDEAVSRRKQGATIFDDPPSRNSPSEINQIRLNTAHHPIQSSSQSRYTSPAYQVQDRFMNQPVSQGSLQPLRSNYHQQRPQSRVLRDREAVPRLPPTEYVMHYRDAPSLRRTPTYASMEQKPPQVVRGSPSQGLKDMLVPSIETSSDGSNERREISYSGIQQDAYSRRGMLSPPPPRQVIVIDDSPEVNRRRVDHDDMPHIVRQPDFPISSSVHSRDFISQPRPRIPIYDDAPSDNFSFVQSSQDLSRRYERVNPGVRELETARSVTVPDSHIDRQRGFPEHLRYAGSTPSSRSIAGTEVFHHEYPEHRVVPCLSDRDDLVSFPSSIRGGSVAYGTARSRPEDQSNGSFITLRRAQDLSPRPIDKPPYRQEESRESIFYDQDGQVIRRQVIETPSRLRQQPLSKPRQPIREVIILD